MFSNPCSVRKRSSSSSGLTPASSLRNTLRISSSSNTIDVLDCSAPTGRASRSSPLIPEIAANSTMPSPAASFTPWRIIDTSSRTLRGSVRASSVASASSWYVSCVPVSKRISTSSSSSRGSSSRSTALSTTCECDTSFVFEAYHRWLVTKSISSRSSVTRLVLLELEPEKPARRHRQQIRQLADSRKTRASEHLLRHQAFPAREVELHRLRRAREIVDTEHDVVFVGAHVSEDARVLGAQRLVGAEPEERMILAQRDQAMKPAQQRVRLPQLRFDVDRLEAVDRVHQRRQIELLEIGAREAAVAIPRPLHRRAHAVAVAEEDVVAHPDLVSVVEDGRAREREEDRVHQLDLVASIVQQRRQAAADAQIQLHPRILGVLVVEVVALVVCDHLERQFVVVAQEEAPLRVVGDRRRRLEDFDHGERVLAADRHEHARHHREVEGHLALVAVAEVLDDVGGPLIRLGEEHAVRVARIDLGSHSAEKSMRLREVLAVRPVTLVEVRHRVEPEPVEAQVEPEAEHVQHLLLHLAVVVVQVGLVAEEAVPVVLPAQRVPGPVRRLG